MSAYNEILKLLRREAKERGCVLKQFDKGSSDALFTAYLVFNHGVGVLKFALAAIKKEQDERK